MSFIYEDPPVCTVCEAAGLYRTGYPHRDDYHTRCDCGMVYTGTLSHAEADGWENGQCPWCWEVIEENGEESS